MRFSTAAFVVASLLGASAQTTHKVIVGGTTLTYQPNQVVAAVGDIIAFEFHQKNHTVTQSTFANPCTAMAGGATSGFMPVDANATTFPVFSIQVNEVTPLWWYCQQANHCQQGMVFAVNVNTSSPNTFDAFLAKATGNTTTAGSTGTPVASSAPGSASQPAGSGSPAASSASTSASAGAAANAAVKVGGSASLMLAAVGAVVALAL